MKNILLAPLFFIILFSCVAKEKIVTKEKSLSKEEVLSMINKKVDSISSLFNQQKNVTDEKIKNELSNSIVEITTELESKYDENGKPIPASFERFIDGKLKESIQNIGGKTVYKTYQSDTKQDSQIISLKEITQVLENKFSYSKQENLKLKSEIYELKNNLKKDIKTVDFTFGFYVLIAIVILLALIILILYVKIRGQSKMIKSITDIIPI